jgi:hypothetical protein
MWYRYTIKYCAVTKKNEIMLLVGKWMGVEITILSEISQAQKDKYHVFTHVGSRPKKIRI